MYTVWMLETTRTYVARITNHRQVRDDLDACGVSASKLWNVGRYYIQERWDETGEIPDDAELKSADRPPPKDGSESAPFRPIPITE